jgi:LysR family transcriptional regulator, transcriptional activator of nhaA
MSALNLKHLRYFWMVAKAGSIARASEQLHLTPQSISGQLATLEAALGVRLFQRVGRQLELTETGRRTLSYADEIFSLGDELMEMLRDPPAQRALVFRVGIADVVPKSVAYRLVEPALRIEESLRLVCREGPLDSLLAELAVHRLDVVIADRSIPASMSVRGYSHFLGESGLTVFAARGLAATLKGDFPACLDNAPFLLPGADVAIRPRLMQWFDLQRVRPRVIGEFDDSALLKAFGQGGSGVFVAPSAIADYVCRQYSVRPLGAIEAVREQLFAITTQRRLTHPAIVAVSQAAREEVFGKAVGARDVRRQNRSGDQRGKT